MASADLSDVANSVLIYAPTNFSKGNYTVDDTFAAGAVVQLDSTFPKVELADADYSDWDAAGINLPLGIALDRDDTDLDTNFTSGDVITVAHLRSGAIVWVEVQTSLNTAILAGDPIYLSETAGQVVNKAGAFGTAATPVVNENASLNDNRIGTCVELSAADASNTRWIKVRLD